MVQEVRTVYLDPDLNMEAYRFKGIMQKFPAHFHEYYVIGFIEEGQRYLVCQGEEYIINPGDVLIFNPYDIHSCEQIDGKTLDYRCLNITADVMKKFMYEIQGNEILPHFQQNVLAASKLAPSLRELHMTISQEEKEMKKEELFLYLLEELIQTNSNLPILPPASEPSYPIKVVCAYLEEHYTQTITLEELSNLTGWSKYHLLRSFTQQKGISPYNYLETIRIHHAKKMLEQGTKPVEVSFLAGFSDQSHLTKFFKRMIGVTPKQYMKIYQSKGDI
ncbi:AraC family ligand binding domain-containing protein [Gracilibacillus alcaliphilus]|uniref:AraC family ligand binding domain-containing protein n=1 Tax=Gracilibacillus alcaliphilus TaxID=1401441 RepID=UPI00195E5970|nr:AraC family transcriptional regulator [Gracilibacillus alcaliphilus]MBM7676044.1 AraC-like DNA-binding protein [Gracilibacillus alcaliphilus]